MSQRRGHRRGVRPRKARGADRTGEQLEVLVGPVAHGGHCVARTTGEGGGPGRVVFVRHALPGERVLVRVTEGGDDDRLWRADTVAVMEASPDRVEPPCALAGPGRCGGCDFQHASLDAQRRLKAAVVAEQLQRLAGLEWPVEVEHVPGDDPDGSGLRWRTRQQYVSLPDGRRGLRAHRSHRVVPVEDCLIARTDAREPAPGEIVEVVAAAGAEHAFTVAADGFWQVHPGAPRVLVESVLDALDPQPGERVLDLYAGVGLFARFLADRVGPGGRVHAVEGDEVAAGHAVTNLAGAAAEVEVTAGDVARLLAGRDGEAGPESGIEAGVEAGGCDLVVLDPPRTGAKQAVVAQVAARGPRAVAYVACDPAALARDVAYFAEHGYRLTRLRALDLFPMTHHVECVALLNL